MRLFSALCLVSALPVALPAADPLPGNWRLRFNGVGSKDDDGTWLGQDRRGALYAVGTSSDPNRGQFPGALILKYDPDGREIWAVRKDSFFTTYPVPAAVDADGNVHLAGRVRRVEDESGDDLIVKYDPDGVLRWEARYIDPDSDCALPHPCTGLAALALDPAGNACATGIYRVSPGRSRSLTILYDREGRPVWASRLDDFGPAAIAADPFGFVVSGSFPSSRPGKSSLLLVRYNTAGAEVWRRQVTADGFEGHELTLDGKGRAGAVAIAERVVGEQRVRGLLVLAYSSDGTEISNRFHPVPSLGFTLSAIVSDLGGNLLASGSVGHDLELFKMAFDGRVLWSARLNAPPESTFDPGGLAVDGAGRVFGSATLWGPAGGSVLFGFDAAGSPLWPIQEAVRPGSLAGGGLLADGSGGAVMVGSALSAPTGHDFLVRKVRPGGSEVWTRVHDEPGDALEWLGTGGFGLDAAGRSYLAGLSSQNSSAETISILLLSVDPEGKLAWAASHPNPVLNVNGGELPLLAVDGAGNSWVAVASQAPGGVPDTLVLRYRPDGSLLWERRFQGAGGGIGLRPTAIARDAAGNLVVAAALLRKELVDWHASGIRVLEVDSGGGPAWTADHAGVPQALAVDREGNVYVAGASGESGGQFLTVKLDRQGRKAWSATFDAPAGGFGAARAIALDPSGEVLVAGHLVTPPAIWENHDALTVRYGPDGSLRWAKLYDGTSRGHDSATSLVLGPEGEVSVAGETQSLIGNRFQQFVVRYDPAGREEWSREVRGTPTAGLNLDRNRRLYVTGADMGRDDWVSWTTVLDSAGGFLSSITSEGRWTLGAALDGESGLHLASLVSATIHDQSDAPPNDFEISRHTGLPAPPGFIRGDCDGNGRLSITDPVVLLRYLFLAERAPGCLDACDADGDAYPYFFTDAVYLLQHSFLGGPPPPPPFPACGIDPAGPGVGCATPEC